jgi:predicted Zn finger-like uncharacterized protein
MNLVCKSCEAKFRIADDKLPDDQVFSLKCPKCKELIQVDTRSGEGVVKDVPTLQSMIDDMASDTYDSANAPFEFVEEGVHTALVCEEDEEIRRKVRSILERLDFNVTEAESTRDALRYMRFHLFDLVAVDESFDGGNVDTNHMLKYLGQFPLSTRRNIFVLLLSSQFRTGDRMMAFNKSVNLVVNLAEIDGLESFLKSSLRENAEFYGILRESLEKYGRI